MKTTDTIFALSTAPGKAGIAVVRISGLEAGVALQKMTGTPLPAPRSAAFCKLKDKNSEILDEAITIWFPAPHSFTGEDVAELHLHGSHAVVNSIIEYLSSIRGLRIAEPGEFSKRAFENGKMDLTQAEGLADLIDSETKTQQKQALRQLEGSLFNLYEEFRTKLIEILANIEAYIDFPDEDIPEETDKRMRAAAFSLASDIEEHLADRRGEILRRGVQVAILGAPNVGKSSLMNWLAKRDVAIVSSSAGTTRDVIEIHMDIGGLPLTLSDTAGLRESTDEIEQQGISRAIKKAEDADIKVCIFSAENWPDMDKATAELVGKNSITIINKSDLKKPAKTKDAVIVSVAKNHGLEKLMDALEKKLKEKISPASDPVITRARHRHGLTETKEHLERFLASRDKGSDIELAAEDLRLAARSLGRITGRVDVEDILNKIFSSFCIGK